MAPQASDAHQHAQSKVEELRGQKLGTSIHHQVTGTACHVNAENIGVHSHTFNQSQTGLPKTVGSCHGASGAQFSGVE